MNRLTFLAMAILAAPLCGCPENEITQNESLNVMRLDNFGGDNHGGRRIILHKDGTFRNEWYDDTLTEGRDYDEFYVGTYQFNDDLSQLTLHPEVDQPQRTLYPEDDADETLYLVEVNEIEYWVAESERVRIQQEDEVQLRDESLQHERR